MWPQHHPSYGVPVYTPGLTYPLHVPPAVHMYYPGPPPLSSHQSTISSQSYSMVNQWSIEYRTRNPTWVLSVLSYRAPTSACVSPLSVAGVFWVSLRVAGQSGILYLRRQLLLPSIDTEEMVKFLVDKEKEEKSPKVQLLDVLVSAWSSVSSKSVAFIPLWYCVRYLVFTTLFRVMAFAIHAPSLSFSDRLYLVILASLLWTPL